MTEMHKRAGRESYQAAVRRIEADVDASMEVVEDANSRRLDHGEQPALSADIELLGAERTAPRLLEDTTLF